VTHTSDGEPIVRRPYVLKVQIGLPPGPDLRVDHDSIGFHIVEGSSGKTPKIHGPFDLEQVEEAFEQLRKLDSTKRAAAPRKLSYFTFNAADDDGTYRPSFEAIEAHGIAPRRIPIMFTGEGPFSAHRSMYANGKLQCWGDGRFARRANWFAQNSQEKKLAAEAEARGSKTFPIEKCREGGCKFGTGSNPKCPPRGVLEFQLRKLPRIGATARFETTSVQTIIDLNTSVEEVRGLFESIAYVPLFLILRPISYQDPKGHSQRGFSVHVEPDPDVVEDAARTRRARIRRHREMSFEPVTPERFARDVQTIEDAEARIAENAAALSGSRDDGKVAEATETRLEGDSGAGLGHSESRAAADSFGDAELREMFERMASNPPLSYESELLRLQTTIAAAGGAEDDVAEIFSQFQMKGPADLSGRKPSELRKLAALLVSHLRAITATSPGLPFEATEEDLPENLRSSETTKQEE
jgi:hypothetical protein